MTRFGLRHKSRGPFMFHDFTCQVLVYAFVNIVFIGYCFVMVSNLTGESYLNIICIRKLNVHYYARRCCRMDNFSS